MISSPSERLIILVSGNIWVITKFERGHPEREQFLRLTWVRNGNFGDFSTNKSPNLGNGARYDQDMTRFRLVPKLTTLDDPELTLNGYYALCYITHHKNWNEDGPILSATKM